MSIGVASSTVADSIPSPPVAPTVVVKEAASADTGAAVVVGVDGG